MRSFATSVEGIPTTARNSVACALLPLVVWTERNRHEHAAALARRDKDFELPSPR